jgi:methylphosphotriester-DNA--protein-cysteine methyltransferase
MNWTEIRNMWTEHRDYDNYDKLAAFQPQVKLTPDKIGYLKRGEIFMAELAATRNKSSNSKEVLGTGRIAAIVYADMDGGIVSENYGEFKYLREDMPRVTKAGTEYINVRTPNFEKAWADKHTNMSLYADEITAIWVSTDLAVAFNERIREHAALKKGNKAKVAQIAAQRELEEARAMLREAEKKIADAQKKLG